jgi:hypothetical protein
VFTLLASLFLVLVHVQVQTVVIRYEAPCDPGATGEHEPDLGTPNPERNVNVNKNREG